jgi:hypothetical protein
VKNSEFSTVKNFMSPTSVQRRSVGASTVVSPMLMVIPAWAEAMRATASEEERLLPWIHEGGCDELRMAGLAQLPDDDDALSVGLQQLMDEYQATSEELVDAMSTSAMEVLQERRSGLASLITEVIQSAPDEAGSGGSVASTGCRVAARQSWHGKTVQDDCGRSFYGSLLVPHHDSHDLICLSRS